MKKIEITLAALILLALFLKALLVPGSSVLFGVSLTALAILYYAFGVFLFNSIRLRRLFKKESYKGLTFLRVIGSVVTGIALSIVITGIMFKDMLLAGSGMILSVGLIVCLIVTIIFLIKYFQTDGSWFYRQVLIRVFVIGCAGSIMLITPGTAIVSFFYRDHPEYVKAYKEHSEDPDNMELLEKLNEEAEKL